MLGCVAVTRPFVANCPTPTVFSATYQRHPTVDHPIPLNHHHPPLSYTSIISGLRLSVPRSLHRYQ
jgi:hypothetical protein